MSLIIKAKKIKQSFKFGNRTISPNVFLSPMAGVTDYPFRRLVMDLTGKRHGMFVSEFISVDGMTRNIPRVCRHMRFDDSQRPFAIQIFGSNPHSMEQGAVMVEQSGADFVEINAGCPAPKIVKRSGGSGLLRELELYRTIISRVVKAVKIPVSVKVRIGFTNSEINVTETCKIAQEEGASLFVIHGRTREQGYKGLADWDVIGEVKSKSGIPVIGNGDIVKVEDIVEKLEKYGLDGVSVGRGAMHNPWIFGQAADLYSKKAPGMPGVREHVELFRRYLGYLMEEFNYEQTALGRLKQLCARIVKGWPGCSKWRSRMLRSQSVEEFLEIMETFYSQLEGSIRDMERLVELNGRANNNIEFGNQF